jgi:hypothetical protein
MTVGGVDRIGRLTDEEALDRRRAEHALGELVIRLIKRWREEKKV